jgi:hypothetical protein
VNPADTLLGLAHKRVRAPDEELAAVYQMAGFGGHGATLDQAPFAGEYLIFVIPRLGGVSNAQCLLKPPCVPTLAGGPTGSGFHLEDIVDDDGLVALGADGHDVHSERLELAHEE